MSMEVIEATLKTARSKIGMREEGGENRGEIVEWALRPWSKAEVGTWAEWCAAFVCTCYYEAGSSQIRKVGTTSVPNLWQRCLQHGLAWVHETEQILTLPKPGDIIFFKGFGHIGLVDHLYADTIYTIEGNHGDAVAEGEYNLRSSTIHGFARIE